MSSQAGIDYRKPFHYRPPYLKGGDLVFAIPQSKWLKNDEKTITLRFVFNRRLFGEGYRQLLPEYFYSMPKGSGVMIKSFATTKRLFPEVSYPGDIDLLIIPYEGNELVLSKTLALELKVVRAKFKKQNKSPNQFGFSQAKGLLDCGFPYVAVAHLIVSDNSPPQSWREIHVTTIIDEEGRCEEPRPIIFDLMPSDLIERSYGRLVANCALEQIGLLAAYISDEGLWYPQGKAATLNNQTSIQALDAIGNYYNVNAKSFFDTPRY